MSKQASLFQQIEEQRKIITYLQTKYKETTGYTVPVPQSWQTFLGVKADQVPIVLPEETDKMESRKYKAELAAEEESFPQALANLNLPIKSKENPKKNMSSYTSKKKGLSTNFKAGNPFHMVELIDLSNFAHRKFNRAGFRELLDSIIDMRCLTTMILRKNGINDNHIEELETLFRMTRIKKIDLSQNEIDKSGAAAIGRILKTEVNHITWIDLSRNNFSYDPGSVGVIVQGLRVQVELSHFALDVNLRSNSVSNISGPSEVVTKLLSTNPKIESMALIDSRVSEAAMKNVETVLNNHECNIVSLNFKFCFLETRAVYTLSKGLRVNRSLVQLNLSNNGLPAACGIYIIKSLKDNICLSILDLSKNSLNELFAVELADTLSSNEILWKVDISYNPINIEGAKAILNALEESNDTLESLGDISKNTSMGVLHINEIVKALGVNKLTKEARGKLMEQRVGKLGEEPKPLEQESKEDKHEKDNLLDSETTDYKLLKPIFLTNQIYSDPSDFRFWNV